MVADVPRLPMRARVRLSVPGGRVWLFTAALAVTAAALYFLVVRDLPPLDAPFEIPWWVLAAAFVVVDIKVIEVHFRRESHAFSLSEVPAVAGLFLLSPNDYLLALSVGAAIALLIGERQAPVKFAFNLANYLLLAVLMIAVFRAIGTSLGPPGMIDYLAAFAATLVSTAVGAVSIATAITLSGGAPQYKKLPDMLQFGALVAVANTSIGLLLVTVLWFSPQAVWLLGIPIVTLFLAYRAWVSEREKHERLELVYQSSRILQHSPELDVALLALLDHARTMFRAEVAEIVLESGAEGGGALRTSSVHDGQAEALVQVGPMRVGRELAGLIDQRRAGFVVLPQTPGGREIRLRQAMVAPLTGERGVIGLFSVGNRLTEGTEFSVDDLRLLETLANQAAVALENGQLEQSLAELSRLKEELRYQAYHDPLTNMPNRVAFIEHASAIIAEERPDGLRPVILLLDLDDFKNVNDSLGHAAGDELLVMVAERIRGCVRDGDMAARLGGDEFAILVHDDTALADALAIAERLVTALVPAFPVHGHDVVIGASVGIAMSTGPSQSPDELLSNADVAMYTAKAEGRRRFAVFDPSLHSAIIARHELSSQLTVGISRSELNVVYQPIVELFDERVVGVEALVRWRHPTRGTVEPEEFISLAEESGAILPLGQFVLREAAAALVARDGQHGAAPFLSVNVSAYQIQDDGFLADIDDVLTSTGLAPDRLVLEITESAMFRDTETTIAKLTALRERGVRIALDDFGTGYSSLSYLRRFPVNILKIARDFVGSPAAGGEDETAEWAFPGAILALGRRLSLMVVAEGIEEVRQLDRLRDMGCEYGQGFLFARPNTIEEALRPRRRTAGRSPSVSASTLPQLAPSAGQGD
jgi:diguanylate cyclase (GGDEF)-like protein